MKNTTKNIEIINAIGEISIVTLIAEKQINQGTSYESTAQLVCMEQDIFGLVENGRLVMEQQVMKNYPLRRIFEELGFPQPVWHMPPDTIKTSKFEHGLELKIKRKL
jgi:hypothetical protein